MQLLLDDRDEYVGGHGAPNLRFDGVFRYLRIRGPTPARSQVKPELECFDTAHVQLASQLNTDGLIETPPFYQFSFGVNWHAPVKTQTMLAMRDCCPQALWTGFGIVFHADAHDRPCRAVRRQCTRLAGGRRPLS